MITKETAVKIWNCYNEIEKAEKLLEEMKEQLKRIPADEIPTFRNAFGEHIGLQLGVPSGPASHTLYGVNRELGLKIIETHITEKKNKLNELSIVCKKELQLE